MRHPPYHILPVSNTAATAWKKARVRRVVGTINGHSIKRAIMSHADGGSFVIVNREFIKRAGLDGKSSAILVFRPDPTPHQLDMPPEFEAALAQDDVARARWESFTPGRRRSLLVYITGAKTEPTRIKRSIELATKIRTHSLYGDLQAKIRPVRPA
ncbi:MAG TPA: YdeI/OmpD-associated family protein [Lacunisphaera sp.]|nr:YdeI/OmpD-associated family protein [Lacunisphaera sp.]